MAHHFNSGVFYGRSAWHGLGTTLGVDDPRRRSVEGTITAAGLDWDVERYPLATARLDDVPEQCRGRIVPDRFAIVRKSDWKYLGNVGPDYRCLQNREIFDWFQPFLDAENAVFETAGSLKGGTIVWALARLTLDDAEITDGDSVRPYLLLSSSHDGSQATRVGFVPIRVVCWNTLSSAHQIADCKLIRVKHTTNQHESLATIRDTMDIVRGEFSATVEQYRQLAATGLSEDQLAKYACQCLDIDPEDKQKEISTRTRNQLQRIVALALTGRGQTGAITAWSAYQGLTEWLSYERQKDQDVRLTSLWFGDSAKMNRKAYDLALQLAS